MQPLWKTVWRFLKKLRIELPHDPAIPFLGIYVVFLNGSALNCLSRSRWGVKREGDVRTQNVSQWLPLVPVTFLKEV